MNTKLIKDAQLVLNHFATGDVTIEESSHLKPHVVFFMGMHETRIIVRAARFIAAVLPQTPVVVSGKKGRGTWLLEQAIVRHCLLHGRTLPDANDRRSESALIAKLIRDEGVQLSMAVNGVPRIGIHLDEQASQSEENWTFSLNIFKLIGLPADGVVLVIQAACNRRRGGETGRRVLSRSGFPDVKVLTLHIPPVDIETLGEADQAIECYRLFGLKKSPASEVCVCNEFETSVISSMPVALRCIAYDAGTSMARPARGITTTDGPLHRSCF